MPGITLPEIGLSSPVHAPIVVCDWDNMDPGFATSSTRAIEFIWAYVNQCGCVAVVGVLQDDNVVASGSRTRQTKSEFVGFTSRIDEVTDSQRIRQFRCKALGIDQDVIM
jgi:hypothetical protein